MRKSSIAAGTPVPPVITAVWRINDEKAATQSD